MAFTTTSFVHEGFRVWLASLFPNPEGVAADMFAILIARAKEDGQAGGLNLNLVEGGASVLQYADDTNLVKALSMQLILWFFEQLSSPKINFQESELFCFGKAKDAEIKYMQLFRCATDSLSFRYLGIPIHHGELGNKEWRSSKTGSEKTYLCVCYRSLKYPNGCWKD